MRRHSLAHLYLCLILTCLTSSSSFLAVAAEDDSNSISIPIHRNTKLARRSSTLAAKEWALRERERVMGKYLPSSEEGDSSSTSMRRREKRASTALSTAGFATATIDDGSSKITGDTMTTMTSSGESSRPTSTVGLVEIQDYEADLEYFASVGVGVPPQYMNVILDTGSADLWIASSNCSVFTGCTGIPKYNATRSLTGIDATTPFSVKYGGGAASGEVWKDYVGFGGYNVSGQGFALCDTVTLGLVNGNLSGLFGLGFQPLAASGVTPFWQNLYQAGVFPFPGFAFSLTRFVNISSAALVEPGGQLTLGYLNASHYQTPINYIPIPQGAESYWLIPMDAVAVNGTNLTTLGSPNVAIDTGTTLIGGPSAAIAQIYSMIPGSQAATGRYQGYFSYPCGAAVNISLRFGGISYNMSSDDFNLGPFGNTNNVSTCLGAFFELNLPPASSITWVIGATFLKNVYSVFRASPPSVGFALLADSSSFYANGSYTGNSTFGTNGTSPPNGFFGPSAVTPTRPSTSSMSMTSVTTAIEAGQTASRIPSLSSSAASRSFLLQSNTWPLVMTVCMGVIVII